MKHIEFKKNSKSLDPSVLCTFGYNDFDFFDKMDPPTQEMV